MFIEKPYLKFWISGAVTSFTGVFIAKVIAPIIQNPKIAAFTNLFGLIIAFGGLYFIIYAVNKRLRDKAKEHNDENDAN